MKFYVYHWIGRDDQIPGAYAEGEPKSPKHRQPYYLDIPDDQIGSKLLELAQSFDLMLQGPKPDLPHPILVFDHKGKRFSTR